MFKAKENFKVYIDSELHEIKEGEIVPCNEELGKHLVKTERCELVEEKPAKEPEPPVAPPAPVDEQPEEKTEEPVEEVKVEEEAQEEKIEEPVEVKADKPKRGRPKKADK